MKGAGYKRRYASAALRDQMGKRRGVAGEIFMWKCGGATPVMELYVLYNEVEKLLSGMGIKIHRPYVGNYFTSLDMMGATLTVMKLDGELKRLVDADAYSMGLRQW